MHPTEIPGASERLAQLARGMFAVGLITAEERDQLLAQASP